jgi:hypothetical protein
MSEAMHKRVAKIRQRLNVRRWEYRQRHYAHGVWYRLRRLLADAEEAYVIDSNDADALLTRGFASASVGRELVPARTLVFAPREAILALPSARPVPVRLSAELLAAHCVALVRFAR